MSPCRRWNGSLSKETGFLELSNLACWERERRVRVIEREG